MICKFMCSVGYLFILLISFALRSFLVVVLLLVCFCFCCLCFSVKPKNYPLDLSQGAYCLFQVLYLSLFWGGVLFHYLIVLVDEHRLSFHYLCLQFLRSVYSSFQASHLFGQIYFWDIFMQLDMEEYPYVCCYIQHLFSACYDVGFGKDSMNT